MTTSDGRTEPRDESSAALVDFYRECPRRSRLMQTLMDPGSLISGGPVSRVDQVLARVNTLIDFAGLVEVEILVVPDDLVNTPFNCCSSCETDQ